jgi:hypothetical protein
MAHDTQKVPTVQKWLNVISSYNGEFKKWEARTVKIIRRYRDDLRNSGTTGYEAAQVQHPVVKRADLGAGSVFADAQG